MPLEPLSFEPYLRHKSGAAETWAPCLANHCRMRARLANRGNSAVNRFTSAS